ncbi:flagellar export protein FliJ [Noviherbaspirillum massiliense]|uniref:flagellar export protein FliJ n=1 Tax=Noviherbaspirillum massiliense TaxID=1465823 RepID=UPI0002F4BBA9|nr:flagellar export protein FliJ [Noviherbaspirillum massiliense]
MATNSAIDTLVELATTQADEAAKRLGLAIRACEDSEQKLALLLQYRDDYQARFQSGLVSGLTAAAYRNFRNFMDKLDLAISGQQQIVDDAKRRIQQERSTWQETERKRMSYDTLAGRALREQQRKESRRDQKAMDEFATRASLPKT